MTHDVNDNLNVNLNLIYSLNNTERQLTNLKWVFRKVAIVGRVISFHIISS